MFEEMTYETIMRSMMEDMPDDIDTSEGSLIFNACAKQAVRLEEAYLILSGIEKNMYADTADLEHLIRNGNDRGCYINQATYSEITAQFNCEGFFFCAKFIREKVTIFKIHNYILHSTHFLFHFTIFQDSSL